LKTYANLKDLQQHLTNGSLTCTDRVHHFLVNIENKKHLNVFLSVYAQEARKRALLIDQKIKNGTAGRLAGLVVGLKDVLSYKDHPVQASSQILQGFICQFTATAVQRLLDEDAIIIGRQNCDEFAMGSSNENSAFGPVLNDLDHSRVAGGSSGGSAVAVMADLCDVSIGSDTGGSVRQPAAFCGVIGLKPTYSRISRHGLIAYGSSFDCIGLFSKNLYDVALVLEIMAGEDEFDSTVSTRPVPAYTTALGATTHPTYRVAYMRDTLESAALQPEIKQIIYEKLSQLKSAGHSVEAIDFPLNEFVLPTYYILATAEASSNLSRFDGVRYGYRTAHASDLAGLYKKTRSEGFGKEVQRRIMLGTFVLSASYYDAYYTKAQKVRRLIRDQIKAIFADYDFIILPTTPTTAFKLGEHTQNPIEMYLADLYSVQANVAGVPGISIPCGVDTKNLPIGIQIMAADFEEAKLFTFSEIIQNLS